MTNHAPRIIQLIRDQQLVDDVGEARAVQVLVQRGERESRARKRIEEAETARRGRAPEPRPHPRGE